MCSPYIVTIFFPGKENVDDLLSQQLLNIQYRIINDSHHAVHPRSHSSSNCLGSLFCEVGTMDGNTYVTYECEDISQQRAQSQEGRAAMGQQDWVGGS